MRAFWKWRFRTGPSDEEIREEMEAHLEMRAALHAQDGLTPEQASSAARRQFGSPLRFREEARDEHGKMLLETLFRDIALALRSFRRHPGYAIGVAMTLAIGLGASTAVFNVVDRVLFRPLPYVQEDRLVWFGMGSRTDGERSKGMLMGTESFVLSPDYLDWKTTQAPFTRIGATTGSSPCALTEENPMSLRCGQVDADFLTVLGVVPALGSDFSALDPTTRSSDSVILSQGLFRSRFGGNADALGKQVSLDGKPHRVIGVLPEGFEMPNASRVDVLRLLVLPPTEPNRRGPMHFLTVVGRLRPGVSLEQARAQMEPLFEQAKALLPPGLRSEVALHVRTLRGQQTLGSAPVSWAFLGGVFLLLLLTGTNVSNLVLSKTLSQSKERAIRDALGGRLLHRFSRAVVECALLGTATIALGLSVAWVLLQVAIAAAPSGISRLHEASLDGRTFAFAVAAGMGLSLLFALVPTLARSNGKGLSARNPQGDGHATTRKVLVATQVAVAFLLMAGAGMLGQSLLRMEQQPLGMQPSRLLTVEVKPGTQRYTPTRNAQLRDEVQTALAGIPGVAAVAMADSAPPIGKAVGVIISAIGVENRNTEAQPGGGVVVVRSISPNYFRALEIPIVRGRPFAESDRHSGDPVVVIDRLLASRLFGGADPVGKRIRPDGDAAWHTVVGVAENVINAGFRQASDPELYLLFDNGEQSARSQHVALVRSSMLQPEALGNAIRERLRGIDPLLPVTITPFSERVAALSTEERFRAAVFGSFAWIALGIAACGLFSVVSFLVLQRQGELGVRMAFGATAAEIRRMILGTATRWALAGIAAGFAFTAGVARYLESFLYETSPWDPMLLTVAATVLLLFTILAAWAPAMRASRMDPVQVLRQDS